MSEAIVSNPCRRNVASLVTIDFKSDSANRNSQWDLRVFEKITCGSWVIFQSKGVASVPIPDLPGFTRKVSYIFHFITIFYKI